MSVRHSLLSFDLFRTGESWSEESLLGGGLRLFLHSRSASSCFSITRRHRLVCWVCSLASLLYALSSSLEAFEGNSLPNATAFFTLAIASLDRNIFSLGEPSAVAVGACCLLLDGWLLGPALAVLSSVWFLDLLAL